MNKLIFNSLMLWILSCSCFAQGFHDVSIQHTIFHQYEGGVYGGGVSFYDFNNDGWDDLSFPDASGNSQFYINQNGIFQQLSLAQSFPGKIKSFVWVDYDNDGDPDLSYTEEDGIFRLFENRGDLVFQEVSLDFPSNVNASNSGISWADYDNDGWLDFYVCRYIRYIDGALEELTNLLFKNNGDGTFTDVTESAGVGNGYTQSFIGTWADFDDDGDLDLHIANDRYLFPNALYENNGDGTFTDIAAQSGTDIRILAMTSSVADYDNDEDLDIYCTNGYDGNHLHRNNGDFTFEDLFEDSSGTDLYSFTWGANWIDYDNNGWKDLYVCTGSPENSDNIMLRNMEDGTFEETTDIIPNSMRDTHGVAKGDFNNDGLYDLINLNDFPYKARLLENRDNSDNNFIKVSLIGTASNRDAIGSKIIYYIQDKSYTEFTTCGSDYCSQDSQRKILGMGEYKLIDTLMIKWPSGLVEKHFSIPCGQNLKLTEGETLSATIDQSGSVVDESEIISICQGQEVTFELVEDYSDIVWSNGNEGSILIAQESGDYWAEIYITDQFFFNSDTIHVQVNPLPVVESLTTENPSCFGVEDGSCTIAYSFQSSQGEAVLEEYMAYSLGAGSHTVLIEDENSCVTPVYFDLIQASEIVTIPYTLDVSCAGDDDGLVSFSSFGGAGNYTYVFENAVDPFWLESGIYNFVTIDSDGCGSEGSFVIEEPDELIISVVTIEYDPDLDLSYVEFDITGGTPPYDFYWDDMQSPNHSFIDVESGGYCFEVVDFNWCDAAECINLGVTNSLNEIHQSSTIQVNSDDIDGLLNIGGMAIGKKIIQIFNSTGQLIKEQSSLNENLSFDVQHLQNGHYFGVVHGENGIQKFRFVKSTS